MSFESDNKSSGKPTLLSIVKDIAKISLIVFAVLVVGWAMLSIKLS